LYGADTRASNRFYDERGGRHRPPVERGRTPALLKRRDTAGEEAGDVFYRRTRGAGLGQQSVGAIQSAGETGADATQPCGRRSEAKLTVGGCSGVDFNRGHANVVRESPHSVGGDEALGVLQAEESG
jgi:hypothetical protein